MALNGRYIPLDKIIEKIYRDTGIRDHVSIEECAEWAGEALKLIAAPTSLIKKVASIPIEDGRGELPCDLYNIVQVREFDTKSPMRSTTDTFHRHFERNSSSSSSSNPTIGEGLYTDSSYDEVKGIFDNQIEDNSLNKGVRDLTYEINDHYIFPNFKSGDVEMAYNAFPVSNTGLPMIPDDIAFEKAVEYYIRHHLNHRMWRTGEVLDKVYQKEEQEMHWYIGKAQNKARLPTYDEMESLKNDHIRLTPKIHQWSDFFESMGARHNDDHNSGFDGYGTYGYRY